MKFQTLLVMMVSGAFTVSASGGTDTKDVKAMSVPTVNSDAGFYVGVYGGAQFDTSFGDQRQVIDGGGRSERIGGTNVTADWGGAGGIKAGYKFESFPICDTLSLRLQPAVEAEALYLGTTGTASTELIGPPATEHTSYNSAAWFVNGILRFKNKTIVTPYIGAGVGGEYVTTHADATFDVPRAPHITGIGGSDVDFAGQALAGFDVAIAPHFDVFTEYKFIDAVGTDIKTNNIAGSGLEYRFKPDQIQQHLITAGVKYSF